MRLLSRLPERSIFGLEVPLTVLSKLVYSDTHFSSDVARLVTQPLWPSSTPRITNCSDMMAVVVEWSLVLLEAQYQRGLWAVK